MVWALSRSWGLKTLCPAPPVPLFQGSALGLGHLDLHPRQVGYLSLGSGWGKSLTVSTGVFSRPLFHSTLHHGQDSRR